MQKQIKNKHVYNITEDKHTKAHKSTLISNMVLMLDFCCDVRYGKTIFTAIVHLSQASMSLHM